MDAYKQKLEEVASKHKGELVFNCGPEVVLMLDGIEEDEEDFYWRFVALDRGYHLASCCGRIDIIKGKIDEEAYGFLVNIFKLNYKFKTDPEYWEEIESLIK